MFTKKPRRKIECFCCQKPIYKEDTCIQVGPGCQQNRSVCLFCAKELANLLKISNSLENIPYQYCNYIVPKEDNKNKCSHCLEKEEKYSLLVTFRFYYNVRARGCHFTKSSDEYICYSCLNKIIEENKDEEENRTMRRFEFNLKGK